MIERGDIRWFRFDRPDKRRPVLVLGRRATISALSQIIVVPFSTTIRGPFGEPPPEELLKHADMPRASHATTGTKKEICRTVRGDGPAEAMATSPPGRMACSPISKEGPRYPHDWRKPLEHGRHRGEHDPGGPHVRWARWAKVHRNSRYPLSMTEPSPGNSKMLP